MRIAASPVPTDERFSKKLLKAMVDVIFVWLGVSRSTLKRWRKRVQQTPEKPA